MFLNFIAIIFFSYFRLIFLNKVNFIDEKIFIFNSKSQESISFREKNKKFIKFDNSISYKNGWIPIFNLNKLKSEQKKEFSFSKRNYLANIEENKISIYECYCILCGYHIKYIILYQRKTYLSKDIDH